MAGITVIMKARHDDRNEAIYILGAVIYGYFDDRRAGVVRYQICAT